MKIYYSYQTWLNFKISNLRDRIIAEYRDLQHRHSVLAGDNECRFVKSSAGKYSSWQLHGGNLEICEIYLIKKPRLFETNIFLVSRVKF